MYNWFRFHFCCWECLYIIAPSSSENLSINGLCFLLQSFVLMCVVKCQSILINTVQSSAHFTLYSSVSLFAWFLQQKNLTTCAVNSQEETVQTTKTARVIPQPAKTFTLDIFVSGILVHNLTCK